jgi:lambda family phage minor tail protein L
VTASIYAAVQQLEPGADVWLFALDMTTIGGDVLLFHGYTQVGPILWQGNSYSPWPLETTGFAATSDQQQPSPKFTVGNIDGSISLLCNEFQDCIQSKLTIHHTLGQFLDGQSGADPTQEFPPDVWFIDSKSSESSDAVEFTLASAMDFSGQQLPGGQILADVCRWIMRGGYRGPYCGYTGGPVATVLDVATSVLADDDCSGTLKGCHFRFDSIGDGSLSFGSFPAAGLTRT